MDKQALCAWLEKKTVSLQADRDHAVQFGNYGKAAQLNGELIGTMNVLSEIEKGDFDSRD